MRKKILSLLCALCLALTLTPSAFAAEMDFTDVKEGDWFYQDVQTMVDKGLMGSVDGAAFKPGGSVTRAMVVTLLWRLEGCPETEAESALSDVPADSYYAKAVSWAAEAGVAGGYEDGTFRPDQQVSREQLAVFLYKYSSYKKFDLAEGVLDIYSDAGDISGWAEAAMMHAVGAGLFNGSAGKLNPAKITTRAELAATISRMLRPVAG